MNDVQFPFNNYNNCLNYTENESYRHVFVNADSHHIKISNIKKLLYPYRKYQGYEDYGDGEEDEDEQQQQQQDGEGGQGGEEALKKSKIANVEKQAQLWFTDMKNIKPIWNYIESIEKFNGYQYNLNLPIFKDNGCLFNTGPANLEIGDHLYFLPPFLPLLPSRTFLYRWSNELFLYPMTVNLTFINHLMEKLVHFGYAWLRNEFAKRDNIENNNVLDSDILLKNFKTYDRHQLITLYQKLDYIKNNPVGTIVSKVHSTLAGNSNIRISHFEKFCFNFI